MLRIEPDLEGNKNAVLVHEIPGLAAAAGADGICSEDSNSEDSNSENSNSENSNSDDSDSGNRGRPPV